MTRISIPRSVQYEILQDERLRGAVRAYLELLGREYQVFPIYFDLVKDYCDQALGEEQDSHSVKQQLHVLMNVQPVVAGFPEQVDGYDHLYYLLSLGKGGPEIEEYEFLKSLDLPYIGHFTSDWPELVGLCPPKRRFEPTRVQNNYPVDLCSDEVDQGLIRAKLEAADNNLPADAKAKKLGF